MPKRAWRIWTTLRATSCAEKGLPRCSRRSRPQLPRHVQRHCPLAPLGKAANYTLALWPKLTRFLEYPELELSNNLAENSMRPVAIGRKNWIHIGSEQAGPKIAAILSVVESCRRLKVSVSSYLASVLPGLADLPIQRLPELTPSVWATQHPL
jgi:transposase